MTEPVSTRIVAIHGFLGQPQDWGPVRRKLKELAPQVKFQTVGLFSKMPNVKERSAAEWAKRFNNSQKNRHLERNILMGYSLGGRLALQAIYDKPGLWDEVVLISSHPGLRSEEQRIARQSSDALWAEKFLKLPWQDVVNLWNAQPVFVHSKNPVRDDRDLNREGLALALVNWSLARHDFAPEKLNALKPTLHWFAGEHDTNYRKLFEDLKTAGFIEDLSIIKNAGHRLIFDNPEELGRQLVQKLDLV